MKKSELYISQEFKEAVKKEFEKFTGKVTLIINQGGIRDAIIELRAK